MTEQEWLASTDPAAIMRYLTHERVHAAGSFGVEIARARPLVSARKLRLFACAVCRQPEVWSRLVDDVPCSWCECEVCGSSPDEDGCIEHGKGCYTQSEDGGGVSLADDDCQLCHGTGRVNRSRRAVEVAERFADGLATDKERGEAFNTTDLIKEPERLYAQACLRAHADQCRHIVQYINRREDHAAQADLLRHIVGNPWRPMLIAKLESVPGEAPERWADPRKAAKLYRPAKPPHWLNSTVIDLANSLYAGEQGAAWPLHDALLDAGAPEELVLHFAEFVPCKRCDGTGWYEDVAGEDLDGMGGRAVVVRCEHDDSLVSMVQEYNDGGTSYWFNLLEPNTRHLTPERAKPKHPKGCWAIDLILGKE